jgi:hypothetical protein
LFVGRAGTWRFTAARRFGIQRPRRGTSAIEGAQYRKAQEPARAREPARISKASKRRSWIPPRQPQVPPRQPQCGDDQSSGQKAHAGSTGPLALPESGVFRRLRRSDCSRIVVATTIRKTPLAMDRSSEISPQRNPKHTHTQWPQGGCLGAGRSGLELGGRETGTDGCELPEKRPARTRGTNRRSWEFTRIKHLHLNRLPAVA